MKLQFIGAARTVTGSCHMLVTDEEERILLDCGLYQGLGPETDAMNRKFRFNPASVSAVVLSHAHIDHCGNLPGLVRQGFSGTIYCTPATLDLCRIMLADSAAIQENEIAFINKKREQQGRKPITPLYTMQDVEETLSRMEAYSYHKKVEAADGVLVTFTDAGHILGSAVVNLELKSRKGKIKLCFTGDIGRPFDPILKSPEPFPQADYIIAESTYGNRAHAADPDSEQQLLKIVAETCGLKKGRLIIPAFSLGRTQEIVYMLDRLKNRGALPPVKVFVDSPLAINATEIMRKYASHFNDEIARYMKKDPDPFGFNSLYYVREKEESIKLNSLQEPCIIIAASGMIEAGRVKHHVKNSIGDERNTILIVGFCTPLSLGGRLAAGEKNVKIYGEPYEVKANVEVLSSYSAHADYNEMIAFLSCQDKKKIKKIFLVHGEYGVQKEYRNTLMKSGFKNIEIPAPGDTFLLG